MLRLRPYKPQDAEKIVTWFQDEVAFRKWSADRYSVYPITADDMNRLYQEYDQGDTFFSMTAFDEEGIAGHLILRFVNEEKTVLRFGFIVLDNAKRGKGYGKEMLSLALKYAFEILKVERVTLGVFENNEAAWGCYRSVGFHDPEPEKTEVYHLMGEEWICRDLEIESREKAKSRCICIDKSPKKVYADNSQKGYD